MKESLLAKPTPPPPTDLVAAFYRLPDRENPFQIMHRAMAQTEMLRRAANDDAPMLPDMELSDLGTVLALLSEQLNDSFSIFTEKLKNVPASYLAAA